MTRRLVVTLLENEYSGLEILAEIKGVPMDLMVGTVLAWIVAESEDEIRQHCALKALPVAAAKRRQSN